MPTQSDYAIVLRLSDFSETSQIATLFCREAGLVRLIAKGARRGTAKRVAVGLDLLELGELMFAPPRRGEGLGTLAEWKQRDGFGDLRAALAPLYAGLYAAELVTFLTVEYDPHPPLFEVLSALLRALVQDVSAAAVETELLRFEAALVTTIGFAPLLDHCTACSRLRPAGAAGYFSSTAGGLVCRDCEPRIREKQRVRGTVIDILRAALDGVQNDDSTMLSAAAAAMGAEALHGARRLLDHHLQHVASREFELASRVARLLSPKKTASAPDTPPHEVS